METFLYLVIFQKVSIFRCLFLGKYMLFQYSITLEVDILPRQLMAQSVWNFIQLSFYEIRYLPSELIRFGHTFFGSFRTFSKVNPKSEKSVAMATKI